MRPIAVVLEFVLGKAPAAHLFLHIFRHARIVGDKIEQAFLVGLVLSDDLAATFISRLGVIVVVADVVGAERPVIVGVGLAVRNAVELLEGLAPTGVEDSHQQFVLLRVVAGGPGKRNPVVGVIGQAHAEAVSLHLVVALAVFARRRRANTRQHSTFRVAGNDIRADLLFYRAEMMTVVQHAGLHAVPFLAVNARRFPAYVIIDAGGGHQVALVSGVDEHLPRVAFAAERHDRSDAGAVFFHAVLAVEPLVAVNNDLMLLDQILEDLFGDVRLENPHRALLAVNRRRALPLIAIFLALLPRPGRGLVIMFPDAVVELARQPANDGFVASVREAQTAAG